MMITGRHVLIESGFLRVVRKAGHINPKRATGDAIFARIEEQNRLRGTWINQVTGLQVNSPGTEGEWLGVLAIKSTEPIVHRGAFE